MFVHCSLKHKVGQVSFREVFSDRGLSAKGRNTRHEKCWSGVISEDFKDIKRSFPDKTKTRKEKEKKEKMNKRGHALTTTQVEPLPALRSNSLSFCYRERRLTGRCTAVARHLYEDACGLLVCRAIYQPPPPNVVWRVAGFLSISPGIAFFFVSCFVVVSYHSGLFTFFQ